MSVAETAFGQGATAEWPHSRQAHLWPVPLRGDDKCAELVVKHPGVHVEVPVRNLLVRGLADGVPDTETLVWEGGGHATRDGQLTP